MQPAGGNWKDFFAAAARGDLELVKFHLASGVDADYQHPEVMTTALIEAASYGRLEVVRALLAHGADAQIRSMMDGWTALEAASERGHEQVAQLLAEHLRVPLPPRPGAHGERDTGGLIARILRRFRGQE